MKDFGSRLKMNIYFSHGKLGTPAGTKIQRLAEIATRIGHTVRAVDYTDTLDPDLRAKRLSGLLEKDSAEKLLVGSSMGGYASLLAAENSSVKGIFLLAPALYLDGYQVQDFAPKAEAISIIHGWSDTTVPVENSIRFAKKHRAALHILDSDHRLYSALDKVEQLFAIFLKNLSSAVKPDRSYP